VRQSLNLIANFVILRVVLSVLDIISTENLNLSNVVFFFPFQEIYFLQELALVELELSLHFIYCMEYGFTSRVEEQTIARGTAGISHST
jgi:hypothetical protein